MMLTMTCHIAGHLLSCELERERGVVCDTVAPSPSAGYDHHFKLIIFVCTVISPSTSTLVRFIRVARVAKAVCVCYSGYCAVEAKWLLGLVWVL